jgi:hypothetical protein
MQSRDPRTLSAPKPYKASRIRQIINTNLFLSIKVLVGLKLYLLDFKHVLKTSARRNIAIRTGR